VTSAEASGRRPVTLRDIQGRGRIRATAGVLGPAFVASVAYVDPGNFATNFAGGAEQGYELVWVIVTANLMAIGIQYLTSKVGLATGQSLPELCRDRFSRPVNVLLWLQAEVVAMATDLAEFVGAAVGLNLVFGVPLFPVGLITALVAFVILGLTVAIIGATVMPHVVYLHSALHKDRVRTAGWRERRTLLTLSKWDCITALGIAGVVNLSMLCIAAALFHKRGLASVSNLGPVHAYLATLAGGGAALAFGIALMASGLSSSSVGTYAG
jgi:manganese transport protein